MGITRRAYVISDLHLGGAYGGADDRGSRLCSLVSALAEFVDAITAGTSGTQNELIINGDFVDFLAEGEGSPTT